MVVSPKSFCISNGVRQGGVLSPTLFNMYIDVLLCNLEKQGIGCHIGDKYYGSLGYADDVILLSPTLGGIQTMLNECESYGHELYVKFNSKKTVCMLFQSRGNKVTRTGNVYLCGEQLKWENSVEYLGNKLNVSCSDSDDILYKRSNFIGSVNTLLGNFRCVPTNLLNALFCTFCCSVYGCQSWLLRTSELRLLSTSYNIALRRIWRLPYRAHTDLTHAVAGYSDIVTIITKRFVRLFHKMYESDNASVAFIAKKALYDSHGTLGDNLRIVCTKYNIACSKSVARDLLSAIYQKDYTAALCDEL